MLGEGGRLLRRGKAWKSLRGVELLVGCAVCGLPRIPLTSRRRGEPSDESSSAVSFAGLCGSEGFADDSRLSRAVLGGATGPSSPEPGSGSDERPRRRRSLVSNSGNHLCCLSWSSLRCASDLLRHAASFIFTLSILGLGGACLFSSPACGDSCSGLSAQYIEGSSQSI